jgi:hypothetical protein
MNEQIQQTILAGDEQQRQGMLPEAIANYQAAYDLFVAGPEAALRTGDRRQLASLSHTLANLLTQAGQYQEAIPYLKTAIAQYAQLTEQDRDAYGPYLALANYHRAEVAAHQQDTYTWRKCLRPAIELYRETCATRPALRLYLAGALALLAESYTHDEPAMAAVHWQQAIDQYETILPDKPEIRPLLAAAINNLAYNQKQERAYDKAVLSYTQTLEQYQTLIGAGENDYLPFLANTYQNLGVMFTEMQQPQEAIANLEDARHLYRLLAEDEPDQWQAYLATVHHNLGIVFDEQQNSSQALAYYQDALRVRRALAQLHPSSFSADFCATALNIITCYQAQMEAEATLHYREPALALLDEVEGYLESIPQAGPAIASMRSDVHYFQSYFQQVSIADLTARHLLRQIEIWNDEIFSTLELDEKMKWQSRINAAIADYIKQYGLHEDIRAERDLANGHTAWLHLLTGAFEDAFAAAQRIDTAHCDSLLARLNQAHALLFAGHASRAMSIYADLRDEISVDKKRGSQLIKEDFATLRRRERTCPQMAEVEARLLSV